MATGRPLKFRSAKELTDKGMEYFRDCEKNEKPFSVTGLALALGTNRETLVSYANGRNDHRDDGFSDAVKRLKSICEQWWEHRLCANNPTGAIFWLKNFGWTDRQTTELTGSNGGPLQIISSIPRPGDN